MHKLEEAILILKGTEDFMRYFSLKNVLYHVKEVQELDQNNVLEVLPSPGNQELINHK